ncbi:hypothetical protein H310_04480 [Aphanomyces invadans]|uniref:BEACH domain-containing protein n=1 Tax=Aphanomyces invadans TaxID=157072 RepID=A0A024UD33_9STRA|nr:hypothetical protein H310_04480 [Aphanomyces invadans]ETW04120.1 hypothetical protein H310_04480 [Aphanomyces invadans]|eukprot:XP_008867076.1 hypothetical protein H310_04480 [Aphanomyces invadans]
MKKQLTKLFSRKKTGSDEHDLNPTTSPPSKSPASVTTMQTPVDVPPPSPPDARFSRMTAQMKDFALACKQFVTTVKADSGANSVVVHKFMATIHSLNAKVQSNMGDASTRWVALYCASDLGIPLSEQATLLALVVESLNRIRLAYIVEHVHELATTPGLAKLPDEAVLCPAVGTLGACMVGMLSNATILDRQRCEVLNVMRLAVDLYAPRTTCIRDVVSMAVDTIATSSAFNAGLVWYLHDTHAIATVVDTMRLLATATVVTSENADVAIGWFEAASTQHSSLLSCAPSPHGNNAEDDVHVAVSKALGLYKEKPKDPIAPLVDPGNDVDAAPPRPPQNEIRPAAESAATSTTPPTATYSLVSHEPSVGHKLVLTILQASCRFSFVLVLDFGTMGGYNVVWSIANRSAKDKSSQGQAEDGMHLFVGLLPLGEGVAKPLESDDWSLNACGAWNDAALIALRDFLGVHIEDATKTALLAPWLNVVHQIYATRTDQFKRVETKTQLVASLVAKFQTIASRHAQDVVLACVQHMAVHGATMDVTRSILGSICNLFADAQAVPELALLLCRSLATMLHQVPTPDHALRETLLDAGLVDRGLVAAFKQIQQAESASVDDATGNSKYIQEICALVCLVLHNHVAACTQFRQHHVHLILYVVLTARIHDRETFQSVFNILVALSGVTKSPLLIEGIEDDVRMLLDVMQRCCREHNAQSLHTLLALLCQYLRNNVTVQRIWRDKMSGMEGLLSALSTLQDHASDFPVLETLLSIVSSLLDAPDTRQYALDHHIYHTIADCIVASGWLASSHAADVLAFLMGLVFQTTKGGSSCAPTVGRYNPDAGVMSFRVYPHLDRGQRSDVLSSWMSHLESLTKPNGDKAKLIAAGVFKWILPLVQVDPLPLLPLIAVLATVDIPMPHLRHYLRVVHHTPCRGLPMLDTMSKVPTVPHTELHHHSYIQVTTYDKVWPPPSGYSFACWFQFPPPDEAQGPSHTVTVPMCEGHLVMDHGLGPTYAVLVGSTLSLYRCKEDAVSGAKELGLLEIFEYAEEGIAGFRICSNDDWFAATVVDPDGAPAWKKALQVYSKPYVMLVSMYTLDQPQCFTRVYFDPATTCLRVETSQKHVLFKNIDIGLFAPKSWHHLVFTHKRAVMGSSLATLYIDGGEIGAKKLSYPAVSTTPGPIRCFLGSDPHLFPSTKIRSICLGPMWLMGDVLPPLAATCMFTLGPAYMHSFPGNGTSQGAIDEWTETTLAAFLHRIIHRKVDVARAAKRLQLRNLALATQKDWQSEMVVSWIDKEDSAIYATMWFRYFIDRHCSMKALGMEWLALVSSFKWTDDTLVLWNLHTDVPNSPQTHVHYADSEPTIPLNLGKLVPSLGGLWSVLVPLADSLDTTADLHRFLRVLTRCLQANPATLAWFLEQKGHAWVTTLLLQHMDLVDASILKAAAKLAISGSLSPHKQAKQPPPLDAKVAHPVIIDVHAITSVLFNVAFRTALPRPLQRELVVLLAYTIQPQNPNAVFNARQLRQSQFIQWCLHLISQICRAGDPGSELKDDLLLTETQQLLATYVQVEVHVDDMLQYSDMLLCALMDADAASLRCTLLHFLVHHVESSPVVARTVVDSVLYRLHQDKKKGMASATSPTGSGPTSPHWCPHDSTFSTDGLEHVLLETICRSKLSPDTPQQPADAQLASRLLFTLAQVQPAFAMHLLVNSQLHVRLKQVLALHAGHAATYVPLLAFVGLIPLSNVAVSSDGSGDDLSGTATFPAKYTPTAMDRDCIDAVWDILGHLWHIRQCTLPTDTTTVAVIMWLNQRLHSDMLFFQAVCRSSCAFLAVILRCRVLPTRSTTEATDNVAPLPISQAGEVCLVTFANQSLVERDDWADNMLFCLHIWPSTASQHDWFSLVTAIVSNAKILEGCASVVAMKNVCSLLLGLLRLIVCRRKRGDKLKRVDPTPSKVKAPNEAWPADLTSTVLAFVCHVIRASENAVMASVLGDEAIQHFYNVLVFCAQAFVLQALYPMQHVASWHLDVLRVVVASKDQFLQQTNVSNVLLYTGSAAAPPIADASAFRLHMRQLSLQGSQKEFVVGQDSDKLFVQCLATALFRILLADPACFEVTQLWQYLLQQRMGLVKEMLILDVKPTLLTTMSTAKKEPLDVFHHGFDQILGIDSLDHCQYRVFFQWIQAQSTLLEDVFSTRTDPMYNQLVDVLEGTLSLRHPKHGQWAIRVAVDPPAPYPLLESTARDECADEAMVQLASEKASVRLAQFVSSQRDDSKQSKAKWDRELANAKYTRSLWSEPVEMHARPTQTVYQLSWEYTALDATEGPGRKRVRLKWQDTPIRPGRASSSAQTPSGAPAKKAASFRVSSEARRYLEFHDAVEVYRQCTYKHDLVDLTKCKFPQTRELLRELVTPLSIAAAICSAFLQEGQYQLLGISTIVVQEIDANLRLLQDHHPSVDQATDSASGDHAGNEPSHGSDEVATVLPTTLFDVADSEAMQKGALAKSTSGMPPIKQGTEDNRDSDEELSDDDESSTHRESILDLRTSEIEPSSTAAAPSPETSAPTPPLDDRRFCGALLRILHRNDQTPHHACNAISVAGMQKTSGVWLMCDESLYFVEGYIVVDDQQQLTKSLADLRAGSEKPGGGVMQKPNTSLTSPVVWRLKYSDIKQFYRIKFQLRPVGLELVDTGGWTYFCTFDSARCREDVFKALFQMPIHNSIYWAHVLRPAPFRSMKRLRQSLTKKWLRGAMSNFEYLIELNALAGRTFNDVTQYPVFPWVLADYTSDVLDLSKDATYRDLSKPMGGLGAKRAEQFRERYAAMATDGFDGSPAFHYGTHYSCSAYVTYYLVRLEPFASMAQELQGGEFDKADRLFRSVGASWTSASSENLQDVRELIPEFFFLPEFLVNANHFDLGTTQNGDAVRDVLLPPWARNDPREFIRLHRRALESKYVSENLHHWIDLIFGYKQQGQEAIDALNVFMHMTYEGTVDIDNIHDPLLREATLAQIENFGQTPTKLFNSPHPPRKVPQLQVHSSLSSLLTHAQDLSMNAQSSIEAYVKWHTPLAPPLVSIGKEYVYLKKAHAAQVLDEPVGDVKVTADNKYVCRGQRCVLVPPRHKKVVDWGLGNGSIALRSVKSKGSLVVVENVHASAIRCGAFCADGLVFVSGGDDAVVNVLECSKVHGERVLTHKGKLTGHEDAVTCVAIDTAFSIILSGSKDCSAIVWDLRTRRYLRDLRGHDAPLSHVGVNGANGNLVTIANTQVRMWSINGDLLAGALLPTLGLSPITAALCTTCDMWQNGVVAVTGHSNGTIACWGVKYPTDAEAAGPDVKPTFSVTADKFRASGNAVVVAPSCHLVVMKLLVEHRSSVTALAMTPDQRQVISGDADGWCMRWIDDSLTSGAT